MVDTKELREKITTKGLDVVADTDILVVLDRLEEAESDALEQARLNGTGSEREAALRAKLEAAEKERDDVAQQLVQSEQGKRKISEECDALRNELASVKEVEFPKKAQAVADAWKGKCKRLEAERDALRAAIKASANLRNEEESGGCKSDSDLSDEALWAVIAAGMITPAHIVRPTVAGQGEIEKERDALRAKAEAIGQQEPARLVTPTAYRWRYRGAVKWQYGELTEETVRLAKEHNHEVQALYLATGAKGER